MTIYLVVPLLVTVAILQSTIVSHFRIWGVFVDLPLLVVVSWGLLRGSREGLVWGFVAGLIILPLITVLLATVVYDILFMLVVWISGYPVSWLDSLFRLILPSAVLNTALMPVVFVIMRWLNTRFGRAEMEW